MKKTPIDTYLPLKETKHLIQVKIKEDLFVEVKKAFPGRSLTSIVAACLERLIEELNFEKRKK